jgi:hypothetical protein
MLDVPQQRRALAFQLDVCSMVINLGLWSTSYCFTILLPDHPSMIRYPIYHIPAHGNMKGISACFLTYHSISSVFQGIYIHPLSHTLSYL